MTEDASGGGKAGASGAGADQSGSNGAQGSGAQNQMPSKTAEKMKFEGVQGEYTPADVANIILANSAKEKDLREAKKKLKDLEDAKLTETEREKKELEELRAERDALKRERISDRVSAELARRGVKVDARYLRIEVDDPGKIPAAVDEFLKANPALAGKPDDGRPANSDGIPQGAGQGSPTGAPPISDKEKEIIEKFKTARTTKEYEAVEKELADYRGEARKPGRRPI